MRHVEEDDTVSASALQCYRCTSSQPGCGKELNIRVQRFHTCPETGTYGGENFCVKVIEKINCTVHLFSGHAKLRGRVWRVLRCTPGDSNSN